MCLILGAIKCFIKERKSSGLGFRRQFVKCCLWIKVKSIGLRETAFEVKDHLIFFYANILKYILIYENLKREGPEVICH